MKRGLLFFLGLIGLPAFGQKLFDEQLKLLYKNTVPIIQPAELAAKLKHKSAVFLLDTRSPREYEVSHLAGSRFVNYKTFAATEVKDIPKSATVVVYCAVGVRSERVGEALLKAGYKQVYNLYGGIFNWKNKKYPVVNQEHQPTDSVHTYNRLWSVWLRKGIKVYE